MTDPGRNPAAQPPPPVADAFQQVRGSGRRGDFFLLVLMAWVIGLVGIALGGAPVIASVTGLAVFTAFAVAVYVGGESLAAPPGPAPAPTVAPPAVPAVADARGLVEALPDPVVVVSEAGAIEALNTAARSVFSLARTGAPIASAMRAPAVITAFQTARDGGRPAPFEIVFAGEEDRVFSCVVTPLGAAPSACVIVCKDLSEAKRLARARADFLANASHELRTPLASLSGFIETLRGHARDDPEARERFLEIMLKQAQRMRRLIDDLMSLSRIEFNQNRPPEVWIDVLSAARATLESLEPVAEPKGVALAFEAPDGPVEACVDQDEFMQIVQNLAENAVKYASAGGRVLVEISRHRTRDDAEVHASRRDPQAARFTLAPFPAERAGPWIVVRVADSGKGIAREHLPRLSERFYRVEPAREARAGGTGLGLAIVKHIVTRSRGAMYVESAPERGAAFAVALPGRESVSVSGAAPERLSAE